MINATKQLIRYANQRFPRNDYSPESAVRHNRRALVRAVTYLRDRPQSRWILDQPVQRKSPA